LPVAERDARLQSLLATERQRGFDLHRAPLLKVTLVEMATGSYRLVLTFHHIILDGWSLQHVVRQFSAAYQELCSGRPTGLTRSRPFGDYIRWLQQQDLDAARRYWSNALVGVDGSCRLPADPVPTTGGPAFFEHETELSAEDTRLLREYAASERITLN